MLFGHGDDFPYLSLEGNFSSNVWYGADTGGLKEYLLGKFSCLERYPEPDAFSLKKMLAGIHGISPEHFLVVNGSITAFYLIAQAWASVSSTILIPSFSEYEDACTLYGHRLRFLRNECPLGGLPLSGQDLCWICNPNNPDGKLWSHDELLDLLRRYPGTFFVVDEAYAGFAPQGGLVPADILALPNLVLVRSISKVHKIPGMRIGYVMARPDVVTRLQRYFIPWSVSAMAVEAGKYVLQHPESFVLPLAEWKKEAEDLMAALARFPGLEVLPSDTPFFLVRLRHGRAADLKRYLLDNHRLLIRDASNFRGLGDGYFRLCAQSRDVNGKLLRALGCYFDCLSGKKKGYR